MTNMAFRLIVCLLSQSDSSHELSYRINEKPVFKLLHSLPLSGEEAITRRTFWTSSPKWLDLKYDMMLVVQSGRAIAHPERFALGYGIPVSLIAELVEGRYIAFAGRLGDNNMWVLTAKALEYARGCKIGSGGSIFRNNEMIVPTLLTDALRLEQEALDPMESWLEERD